MLPDPSCTHRHPATAEPGESARWRQGRYRPEWAPVLYSLCNSHNLTV